ncbi:DUF973 family protein [Acidianus sulfidivorans JP7]|uniref:DUF973 domain-containing protein n=1 Tax=Acidianus sulfidivorans JP7 TaxID=619593 RepID=A0A2U9IK14_9CREN|nr:DUF973 family protein [Acidianus sulfidivorans]AWR96264.1 DUF973 family protein [Acidianus sulfidivorans JP7]
MRTALKVRKSKKGISGAVTALILVIASVIIALVVVGFAFGLFGAFAGKATVNQVGTGTINLSTDELCFELSSSGSTEITSVQLVGSTFTTTGSITINAGLNTISVDISGASTTFVPGDTYSFVVSLANGDTVTVEAQAVAS